MAKQENFDALHSFLIDVLKIEDQNIQNEIKKTIDSKTQTLLS